MVLSVFLKSHGCGEPEGGPILTVDRTIFEMWLGAL